MSFHEKRSLASIISFVLVFGAYFIALHVMRQNGLLEGEGLNRTLGVSILILIVAAIVTNIVLVTLSVTVSFSKDDDDRDFTTDERDKLIELRGCRVSKIATGIGFVLSIVAMSLGLPPNHVVICIVASFGIAAIAGNLTKLMIHRRARLHD
jgi:hypothetical protein